MKRKLQVSIIMLLFCIFTNYIYSQVPNIKTVSNFILFTSIGEVTNTGATVTGGGYIGTNLGGITGFGVNNTKHIQNEATTQGSLDLRDLYNEIDIIPNSRVILDVDLPLRDTYTEGVYSVGSAVTLGITLTLDARNNPDALFIFKVTGAFSAAAGTRIILTNGALAKNVYFNVDGAIHFGAGAIMKGTFISNAGAITFATGATLEGRALTNTGAISLYENLVMNVFTKVPIYTIIQPNITQTTGILTILNPKDKKITYSVNGCDYTNTTGIFTLLPGKYTVTAKDSVGCISAGSDIKIIPFLNLGVNSEFAVFTINGKVSSSGPLTKITGNLGYETGEMDFTNAKICGEIHQGDTISKQASADLKVLNTDLLQNACDTTIGTVFGNGQILHSKVYCFGAALILTGDLTLDAQGDPNAIFIFKIDGAFKTAENSKVILKNSASMCNIYWQVNGAITIEKNSDFRGNIVCTGAIVFEDSCSLHGRALSLTGAITLGDKVQINILPSPIITIIQPTNTVSTGTIIITSPKGTGIYYSIDGKEHNHNYNSTGVFTEVPLGTYTVTAWNTECSSCPGTTLTIGLPTWTGEVNNDWNNAENWNPNSVPTADQNVRIPKVLKNPVVNLIPGITAECYNLTIERNAVFTIYPGSILTVHGSILNKGGTSGLVIKASPIEGVSHGSLIFNNSKNDSVNATVEMYSKASWDKTQIPGSVYRWQYFGIPVRSVKANPTFAGSYVRKAYESGSTSSPSWVQLGNESTLTSFAGYEIVQQNPTIITFTGALENASLSCKLDYTEGAYYPGQHLIVNPYMAAIDISKLKFGTAMDSSVYFYNTGTFNDWKNSKAIKYDSLAVNPGQYIVSTVKTAGKAIGIPGQIPSMQAFLVKALMNSDNATLEIPYSSVALKNAVKQTAPGLIKTKSDNLSVFTRIDVKGSRFGDCMWIFTDPACSHGFDNGWDGRKFTGSPLTPQLFAMEEDEIYQINAVDDINNSVLGFQAGEDTSYKLTFTHQNMESIGNRIYLHDLLENKVVEITKNGSAYAFTAHQTDSLKRFKIVTSPYITVLEETDLQFKLYNSNQLIFIQNFSDLDGTMMLYDMAGRCRQRKAFTAKSITVIKTDFSSGAYIIHAITKSGKEQKQLVLI